MRRKATGPRKSLQDRQLPKYSIAIAADLSGVPQQQLRRMEEGGLVTPQRTDGNTRRYSDDDLTRIATVAELADEGVNMAGIHHILALRAEVAALRAKIEQMRQDIVCLRGGDAVADQDGMANRGNARTLSSLSQESGA